MLAWLMLAWLMPAWLMPAWLMLVWLMLAWLMLAWLLGLTCDASVSSSEFQLFQLWQHIRKLQQRYLLR